MKATNKQPLLIEAFEVLLKHLGPEKTAQMWQVLVPPQSDYLKIREELFKGKNIETIYQEAKSFNRK